MNLAALFIKRPITTTLITLGIGSCFPFEVSRLGFRPLHPHFVEHLLSLGMFLL